MVIVFPMATFEGGLKSPPMYSAVSQDVITIQTVMTGFTFRLSSEKFMVLHSFQYRKIPKKFQQQNSVEAEAVCLTP